MKEYIKAQNRTNELVLTDVLKIDELHRFSQSDFRWANNKQKEFLHKKLRKARFIKLSLVKTMYQKCLMSIGA